MAEVHNPETCSYNMSKISGKDTKPEMLVRRFLHGKGLRYRLHDRKLPGKPDLVFARYKTVIFVNGCFWHGHEGCRYFVIPKTRTDWWTEKISNTKKRDSKAIQELKIMDWKIITLWECQLKKEKRTDTLNRTFERITEE